MVGGNLLGKMTARCKLIIGAASRFGGQKVFMEFLRTYSPYAQGSPMGAHKVHNSEPFMYY